MTQTVQVLTRPDLMTLPSTVRDTPERVTFLEIGTVSLMLLLVLMGVTGTVAPSLCRVGV